MAIRCHRCKSCFREKARRLQSGYSRQCISCETMLFFDDGSADKNIQRTLRDARRIRKELREAEAEKFATSALVSSSRESSSARSTTSGDADVARASGQGPGAWGVVGGAAPPRYWK